MPPIAIKVTYKGAVPGSLLFGQREWNNLLKEAWYEVGKFWHVNFRPKHFTKEGAREYGYTPRSGEQGGLGTKGFWRTYTGRKQRKFHHTLPLVFSGELRELSGTASITPTYRGVKVALARANKANWHNPKSQIDMRDELTRVSDAEAEQLAEVQAQKMQFLLNGFDKVHTWVVAGGSTAGRAA